LEFVESAWESDGERERKREVSEKGEKTRESWHMMMKEQKL
jgi:hypothetical protein